MVKVSPLGATVHPRTATLSFVVVDAWLFGRTPLLSPVYAMVDDSLPVGVLRPFSGDPNVPTVHTQTGLPAVHFVALVVIAACFRVDNFVARELPEKHQS